MKKLLLILIATCWANLIFSQDLPVAKLLGRVSLADLQKPPFAQWYQPGYQNYHPNPGILTQLKKLNTAGITLKIVFGTWCGDSKYELPRFMKLLDQINFSSQKITLIAVNNLDSVYKQSPTGEDRGLNAFRVPAFIVYENGVELNRINESPVESLERDLLKMLNKETYTPNYASYPFLTRWLKEGLLNDENINYAGLANQIRYQISTESELNAAAYYLLHAGQEKAALTVFRMNAYLYPKSSNVFDSLADAYWKNGNKTKALAFYEQALKLDPNVEETRNKYKKLLTVQ